MNIVATTWFMSGATNVQLNMSNVYCLLWFLDISIDFKWLVYYEKWYKSFVVPVSKFIPGM